MNKAILTAKLALLSAVAVLLIALPISNTFFGNGGLNWIFRSPGTGLFLTLAAAGLMLSFLLLQVLELKVALTIILVMYAACSAHVGTLLPLLVLLTYGYGIVCLGNWVLGLARVSEGVKHAVFAQLVVGVLALSAVFWSFAKFGPRDLASLRLFAIFVVGASIAVGRVPCRLAPAVGTKDPASNFALASVITLFFAMLAKAQVSVDADSLWYGVNADRKLFGDHGVFSSNGLVAHVNYYPKLFELMQAPLMGLGSSPLLLGTSLLCWVALAFAIVLVLELLGVTRRWSVLAAALVVSTPCIANISIAAKGEVLAAWFCVVSVYFHLRWQQDHNRSWAALALISAIFAPLARLSVLPYAAMVFAYVVGSQLLVLREPRLAKREGIRASVPAILLAGLALYVFVMVNYRTLKLAGVLLISPDALIGLQSKIGLHLHDNIGQFVATVRIPFLSGSYAYLLDPGAYSHAVVFWVSNAWAFLIIATFLFWSQRKGCDGQIGRTQWLFLISSVVGVIFLFCYRYTDGGADGNYFIMPIAFGLMAYFVAFGRGDLSAYRIGVVRPLVCAFVAANVAWCLSTVNWNRGDDALVGPTTLSAFWSRTDGHLIIYDQGLGDIDDVLRNYPGVARVVGDLSESTGSHLHASYEALDTLRWAAPQLLGESAIKQFIRRNGINFLILSKGDPLKDFQGVRGAARALIESGEAALISENQEFDLIQIDPPTLVDHAEVTDRGLAIGLTCTAKSQFSAKFHWSFDRFDKGEVSVWTGLHGHYTLFARDGAIGNAETGAWLKPSSSLVFREGLHGPVIRKVTFASSICLVPTNKEPR